jgi:L-threonylcarbamoyladenylate synthase
MRAVIEACGFPLAAPSANRSNELSPTTAAHVARSLSGRVGLIVDGGPCPVGIESTVLDLSVRPPRVLRPGTIHAESLCAVSGTIQGAAPEEARDASDRADAATSAAPLRSPGQLPKHYAPQARLVLLSWRDEADLRRQLARSGHTLEGIHVVAHACVPSDTGLGGVSVVPHDPAAFARAIYAELHRCDAVDAELIVVETPPETSAWVGVLDRLKRAAAP